MAHPCVSSIFLLQNTSIATIFTFSALTVTFCPFLVGFFPSLLGFRHFLLVFCPFLLYSSDHFFTDFSFSYSLTFLFSNVTGPLHLVNLTESLFFANIFVKRTLLFWMTWVFSWCQIFYDLAFFYWLGVQRQFVDLVLRDYNIIFHLDGGVIKSEEVK